MGGRHGAESAGKIETAAPLPLFFLQKDQNCRVQFSTFGVVKSAVMSHVSTHENFPLRREWLCSRFGAVMVANPVEHGLQTPSGAD